MYIIGVKNLIVEVDTKYIKGMINNPNIQPNATINRWIAGILLFNFKLRHVSTKDHAPADGLLRRPEAMEDPAEVGDAEEWIDHAYTFSIEQINDPISLAQAHQDPPESKGSYQYKESPPLEGKPPQISSPTPIPRTERAVREERKLAAVRKFLENPQSRPSEPENDLRKFTRYASEFFVLDMKLWRKDRHSRHKIVVPEGKRLELIHQAHDDLGHKGTYTV